MWLEGNSENYQYKIETYQSLYNMYPTIEHSDCLREILRSHYIHEVWNAYQTSIAGLELCLHELWLLWRQNKKGNFWGIKIFSSYNNDVFNVEITIFIIWSQSYIFKKFISHVFHQFWFLPMQTLFSWLHFTSTINVTVFSQ